uniref:DUF202 domain-containing protein n=1 Tax=Cupriavidus sp. WGlv3 TaxID=2919924 RepID=UPI003531972E
MRDPGVQPERTALAWYRTALTMLVNGSLLVRSAAEARSPLAWTVALLVFFAALVLFTVGSHRSRALLLAASPSAPHVAVITLLVGAVWLACTAEILSILQMLA